MDPQPPLTVRGLMTHVIAEIATALSDRPGEAPQQRAAGIQAATHTIMAFQPRNAIEAMLAGHCVMFHELIVDSVHDTLRGEENATRRPARGSIVAMDKAFGNNLARLERYQTRCADASADPRSAQATQSAESPVSARPPLAAQAVGETGIADRVQRHQAGSQASPKPPAQTPFAATAATSQANQEAVAALVVVDPPRFVQALGVPQPGVPQPGRVALAAGSAQISALNGHAVRNPSQTQGSAPAGNRQARRHPGP